VEPREAGRWKRERQNKGSTTLDNAGNGSTRGKINPSIKFQSESSSYDVNHQTNQMDNFIASGANLMLLNAADSKGIAPAVLRAKAAGVTVVAVDVGAEGGVDATVTSNNKQAGQLDGKYVADRLKGKGQIAIVNGPPVSAVTDRVAGFS
jgi:ribose transport system substrate-binding protein